MNSKKKEKLVTVIAVLATAVLMIVTVAMIMIYNNGGMSEDSMYMASGVLSSSMFFVVIVYALLIILALHPDNTRFNNMSLAIIVLLELAVAIESSAVPMASTIEDFQAVDIPLNYAALYMRPAFFASLALAYRVWCVRRKAAENI